MMSECGDIGENWWMWWMFGVKKNVISLEASYSVTKLLDIPKKKENNFHRNFVSKTLITQGQNNGTKFLYK